MPDNPKRVRKICEMPVELAAEISSYRFAAQHKREAEAIRTLLRLGLDVAKAAKETKRR